MAYLFTFIEGIASFISPCILPMLPIYISYFAGDKEDKKKALTNSIAFVIGFSLVFTLLAIIANRIGNTVIGLTKYAKMLFGIFIILLGFSYLEIIKINIFNKFKKFHADTKNLNFFKSLVFGMLFSISITPCVGTFLSSALLLVATKEKVLEGIVLIVLYCLGLGIPYIISSILIDKMKNIFSFIKKNFRTIRIISGIILIVMGIYIIFF